MTIVILLVLLFLGNGLFAQQENLTSTNFQEDLEHIMLEKNVPVVGIGIIEDGVLCQVKVYGELIKNTPAPYNAIFNIASLSKPISTLLTLQLVSNGDWDLDEPLYHYWVDPDVKDDPLHKKLTTRHVLTHQTGVNNWRRMHKSKKLTFNFEPGTICKYSSEGFEYLRRAMEQKFNKPIEELVDSLIFKPYGMNDSRLLWDENMHRSRYAEEHNKAGEPYNLCKRTSDACASDDVLTTIEDFCLFGLHVMKGSGLADEVYQDMLRLHVIANQRGGFGLGWYIVPKFFNGEYALVHDGSDAGVATKVILMPASKRGLVIFTNGDYGWDIIEIIEAEFFASGSNISRSVEL